jgi:hypothetical protein
MYDFSGANQRPTREPGGTRRQTVMLNANLTPALTPPLDAGSCPRCCGQVAAAGLVAVGLLVAGTDLAHGGLGPLFGGWH